jgi:hypothetical protein
MTSKEAELIYSTPIGHFKGHLEFSGPPKILVEAEVTLPILQANIKISECRIFNWKIKATEDCCSFKVTCKFEPNCKVVGGPESGEHLYALSWESEKHIASLGTDDGEYLNLRAITNIIPKRFATDNPEMLSWMSYSDAGLEIKIPDLLENESIEVRFSIAWKEKELNKSDVSTWLAVGLALQNSSKN